MFYIYDINITVKYYYLWISEHKSYYFLHHVNTIITIMNMASCDS